MDILERVNQKSKTTSRGVGEGANQKMIKEFAFLNVTLKDEKNIPFYSAKFHRHVMFGQVTRFGPTAYGSIYFVTMGRSRNSRWRTYPDQASFERAVKRVQKMVDKSENFYTNGH